MQIRIRRRGGFAGLDETIADVDTAALSEDDARRAGEVVEKLRAEQRAPPVGADHVRYEIAIAGGAGPHTNLTVVDEARANDPAMSALIDLIALVGPARKR